MGKGKNALAAPSGAVDPTLGALFASSAGPAKPHPKSRYAEPPPKMDEAAESEEDEEEQDEDASMEEPSDVEGDEDDEAEEIGSDEEDLSSVGSLQEDEAAPSDEEDEAAAILKAVAHEVAEDDTERKRKRKRRDEDNEGIESKYLQKLVDSEEPVGKRQRAAEDEAVANGTEDVEMEDPESEDDGTIPVHESLAKDPNVSEVDKAARTVYISNVSTEAITSATAKKTLMTHLESVLDRKAERPQSIESIRFRSIAFATAGIPKRAAFIKKNVMDATTKAANAYVVYSDAAGCRAACAKLNGTIVLDRHIRVDSVAHPGAVDHRRCVFVGNLGFVDDEIVINTKVDEEGNEVTEKRKRTKTPMDVEEGLWRVFGQHAGKVENVRVVRDPVTRVGKGFAYVQFYDGTSVESALLLSGKRYPPMLPRELRVTRCRAPHKTARALEAKESRAAADAKQKKNTKYVPKPTAEAQTLAGRAGKLLGRSGALQFRGNKKPGRFGGAPGARGGERSRDHGRSEAGEGPGSAFKTPEQIVFEGKRASAKDGKPRDLKFKGAKSGATKRVIKKNNHGSQRAQAWKSKQVGKK